MSPSIYVISYLYFVVNKKSVIYATIQGGLHFQETVEIAGGWPAVTNDFSQWLQVDLGRQQVKVTRVAKQGGNGPYTQLVTKCKL